MGPNKKTKDYGIKRRKVTIEKWWLFIPFPFAFYLPIPSNEKQKITMQKHPKMSLVASAPVCPYTINILNQPVQLSPYAFNRYLRKHSLYHKTANHKAYVLPCDCFVLVQSSGIRHLSILPF